jgi:hypothetical protein
MCSTRRISAIILCIHTAITVSGGLATYGRLITKAIPVDLKKHTRDFLQIYDAGPLGLFGNFNHE